MSSPEQAAFYDNLRALRKMKRTRGGRKLSPSQIRDFSYKASQAARAGSMLPNRRESEAI